jgi:hypothetical protein
VRADSPLKVDDLQAAPTNIQQERAHFLAGELIREPNLPNLWLAG